MTLLVACGRDDDTTVESTIKKPEIQETITQTGQSVAINTNEQVAVLLDSATDKAKQFAQDSKPVDLTLRANDEAPGTIALGEASAATVNGTKAEEEIISMQTKMHTMGDKQLTEFTDGEGMTNKAMNELISQLDKALDSLEQSASETKAAARTLQQDVQE